ncbi:MAG: hypothetical protein LBT14_05130 [Treponema sp.]|nr:hypothetical protein [Treponema sp.]
MAIETGSGLTSEELAMLEEAERLLQAHAGTTGSVPSGQRHDRDSTRERTLAGAL